MAPATQSRSRQQLLLHAAHTQPAELHSLLHILAYTPRWGMPMTTLSTPWSAAESISAFMPGISASQPSRPNLQQGDAGGVGWGKGGGKGDT